MLLLTGAANVFSWILATEQVPAQIASFVFSLTDEPALILLIIMVFLLLWGTVMDMLPAIFIVIPILLPLATEIGIDPVHFGVICTFNLVIGLITPPYGTALFTGSIVLGMPIGALRDTAGLLINAGGLLVLSLLLGQGLVALCDWTALVHFEPP